MTKEEIIKAWFAIDEKGGENIHTELFSFHQCGDTTKHYKALIRFIGHVFFAYDVDAYMAMEKVINAYSEYIIKNESK